MNAEDHKGEKSAEIAKGELFASLRWLFLAAALTAAGVGLVMRGSWFAAEPTTLADLLFCLVGLSAMAGGAAAVERA